MAAAYPEVAAPANTPVRLPRSDAGAIPARSTASQDTSSSSRCCGSMAWASRGLIPKNAGSNPATSATNPPCRARSAAGSRSPCVPRSQPRSAGRPAMASVPEATSRHRSSGASTPPGYRQAIPTIATGSSAAAAAAGTAAWPSGWPASPAVSPVAVSWAVSSAVSWGCRNAATAAGVG